MGRKTRTVITIEMDRVIVIRPQTCPPNIRTTRKEKTTSRESRVSRAELEKKSNNRRK